VTGFEGTRALLRLERLRWQTGWHNALHASDGAARRRVIRAGVIVCVVAGGLLWLASDTLGAGGTGQAPAAVVRGASATALFVSLLLFADGARRASRGPADPFAASLETVWLPAAGVGAGALAVRGVVRAALALAPFGWAPLIATSGVGIGRGPVHTALLAAAGVGFVLLGDAAGSLWRGAGRASRTAMASALAVAFTVTLAAIVCLEAGVRPPVPGLVTVVAAPWGVLLGRGGSVAAPAFLLLAAAAALAARQRAVLHAGWTGTLHRRTAPDGVRPRTLVAPGYALLVRSAARLRVQGHDALALAVVGAATAAGYVILAAKPAGPAAMLSARSLPVLLFFSLLLPGIMLAELAWAPGSPATWTYVRAVSARTGRPLVGAAAVTGGALLLWTILLGGLAGVLAGWPVTLGRFLSLGTALAVAGTGSSALGAMLALRLAGGTSALAPLVRYAVMTAGLAAVAVAFARTHSPATALLAAALVAGMSAWGARSVWARTELSLSES